MRIREGDPLEIYTTRDGEVIFKKYSLIGGLEDFAAQFCDTLSRNTDFTAAVTDRDGIVAVAGAGKRELLGKNLSPQLEQIMEQRSIYQYRSGQERLPVSESTGQYAAAVAAPILCGGDVLGLVLFVSAEDRLPGEGATMQVDGYSLDAQKEKLKRYAEFQNMEIVNEYSDEGKSGKSVEGRPEFQRMLDNIENGTDEVQFVLVFKLSRFGRNAADVLNSLQRMQDFGVNLICVEDGIDSSKDSGKLMISVLSAVAEIERENILVQTMEGRKQKAREGKWNGGFAPYGYELVNGELQIAEDEAEIIRLIYDKFIHTNMGISAIAAWLNQHGYKKKKRQNNTLDAFAASFIKGVLDNPVYCGKLAYGRRKNEKVSGTRNEYRIVKQENYMLHDGIHEGIVSETDWELAHQKREKTGVKYEKTHSLDHEHILSGILRCPLCGSGMYGNVNRKKKKDGTLYKDYFYYACKHRRLVDGHKCGYRKQWSEEKINNAVEEVIRKLVKNPKFEEAILNKIGSRIDTEEIEKEIERLEKQHRQLTGAKARLGQQMDSLDIMDKFYEKKYQDMETRLYRLYDEIEGVENSIEEVKNRLLNIRQQKISEENVYQFLLYFDKLYDKFTDLEKKEFLNSFVEQVDIYEQEQPDGRFLKHIKFRFPVYFGDRETQELCWDNESIVETVCCLQKREII